MTDTKGMKGTENIIIPVIPNIHSVIYAAVSQPAALDMSTWHKDSEAWNNGECGTTHCRAGWTVALAGEAGRALEEHFNTQMAAMLIYRESGYQINPCRFYDDNETAMEDMRRLAEEEQKA